MRRFWFLLALVALFAWAALDWARDLAVPSAPATAPLAAPLVPSAVAVPALGATMVTSERMGPDSVPPPAFASFDEDGKVVADAVRDGLVLWVHDGNGASCADLPITAMWRKGFGLYGKDVGRTDSAGRFPTTVAAVDQFELLQVEHERLGELSYGGAVLTMANDPRVVEVVVPDLSALRVRVVDGAGQAVAGAKVTVGGGAHDDVPRQHVLSSGAERSAVTDTNGAVVLTVPHGIYDVAATAEDCTSPQAVSTTAGRAGGDAVVVLLRSEHRVDVDVHVTLPPGISAPKVSGWTKAAPMRTPAMHGRGLEPEQRTFFVDRQSDRHFVVRAEDVPWRLAVAAERCTTTVVDVPRGQREVAVALVLAPPPPAKARLVVTVLGLDGKPASAQVHVHETPDYVYGSDHDTDRDGRVVITREPKGRVCVSARDHKLPWTVSEPIDLTAGDHEVTLRLQPALRVSGRVVDAHGNTVPMRVVLRRPAGPLRGLAEGVPEILEDSPTKDSYSGIVDGRFVFDGCGPGDHVVWAFPERGWPAKKRVTPGVEATIVLGEGIDGLALVQGVVRDSVTLAPMAGVVIRSDADVGGWHNETDADGRFRFAARPGEVAVQMRKLGYVLHTVTTANVAAGPAELDLRLPPSPVLFVRVVDAAGAPIAGAEVSVLGSDGEPIELMDAAGYAGDLDERTNGVGRADIRGAPAGALKLCVERGDETRGFDVAATAGRDGVVDLRW